MWQQWTLLSVCHYLASLDLMSTHHHHIMCAQKNILGQKNKIWVLYSVNHFVCLFIPKYQKQISISVWRPIASCHEFLLNFGIFSAMNRALIALMMVAIELNSRLWAIISTDNTRFEQWLGRSLTEPGTNLICRVNWVFVTKFQIQNSSIKQFLWYTSRQKMK